MTRWSNEVCTGVCVCVCVCVCVRACVCAQRDKGAAGGGGGGSGDLPPIVSPGRSMIDVCSYYVFIYLILCLSGVLEVCQGK